MNDISRNFFKNYAQRSNTMPEKRENIVQKKKRALPLGDDTLLCSFRLRSEEITFIESLPGDSRTEKLRRLLTWGRGVGNAPQTPSAKKSMLNTLRHMHGINSPETTDQVNSFNVIYALVTRIEKLEAAQKQS